MPRKPSYKKMKAAMSSEEEALRMAREGQQRMKSAGAKDYKGETATKKRSTARGSKTKAMTPSTPKPMMRTQAGARPPATPTVKTASDMMGGNKPLAKTGSRGMSTMSPRREKFMGDAQRVTEQVKGSKKPSMGGGMSRVGTMAAKALGAAGALYTAGTAIKGVQDYSKAQQAKRGKTQATGSGGRNRSRTKAPVVSKSNTGPQGVASTTVGTPAPAKAVVSKPAADTSYSSPAPSPTMPKKSGAGYTSRKASGPTSRGAKVQEGPSRPAVTAKKQKSNRGYENYTRLMSMPGLKEGGIVRSNPLEALKQGILGRTVEKRMGMAEKMRKEAEKSRKK